ncbi:hypothetical protein DUI87_23254 [Hirundo rustica rustica]|uniref:Uncharacterized protein n=1 Tax=Hirundo rustica rustica TaxID=333673 RepID=A0A3M0K0H6_HIRRU|nr:hypothetical protein DUI87_23254 [Hirundo rustica rustica]
MHYTQVQGCSQQRMQSRSCKVSSGQSDNVHLEALLPYVSAIQGSPQSSVMRKNLSEAASAFVRGQNPLLSNSSPDQDVTAAGGTCSLMKIEAGRQRRSLQPVNPLKEGEGKPELNSSVACKGLYCPGFSTRGRANPARDGPGKALSARLDRAFGNRSKSCGRKQQSLGKETGQDFVSTGINEVN